MTADQRPLRTANSQSSDERGEEQKGDEPALHSEAALPTMPLSAAAIREA